MFDQMTSLSLSQVFKNIQCELYQIKSVSASKSDVRVTFHGIQVPQEYFIINIRPILMGHRRTFQVYICENPDGCGLLSSVHHRRFQCCASVVPV